MTTLITGSSKGIGKAITLKMIESGIEVYGISRTSSKICSPLFHEYLMDLTDTKKLMQTLNDICNRTSIDILINNAGCGYYGLHEELNAGKIHEMITTNFEVPALITNYLLRDFKKNGGTIINISSVTAKNCNPHGAVYGATKAALTNFSNSIFAEARKYGVRVCAIHPEMTDTGLYRNADFEADRSIGCCLYPETIADCVMNVINQDAGVAVNDITINPQFHRIKRK